MRYKTLKSNLSLIIINLYEKGREIVASTQNIFFLTRSRLLSPPRLIPRAAVI